jgi:hypothetical protein
MRFTVKNLFCQICLGLGFLFSFLFSLAFGGNVLNISRNRSQHISTNQMPKCEMTIADLE